MEPVIKFKTKLRELESNDIPFFFWTLKQQGYEVDQEEVMIQILVGRKFENKVSHYGEPVDATIEFIGSGETSNA